MLNTNALQPFINTDFFTDKKYLPNTFQLQETDNYFLAGNKFSAGIIFKEHNTDKEIEHKFGNEMDYTVKAFNIGRDHRYYITFNRKDILQNLKPLWVKIKAKAKEQGGFLRKVSTFIEITIDTDKYLMSYKLTDHTSYSDIVCQDIDTNLEGNFRVVFNLQYFENILNLIKDEQIKLKTDGNNKNIMLFVGDSSEAILMSFSDNM